MRSTLPAASSGVPHPSLSLSLFAASSGAYLKAISVNKKPRAGEQKGRGRIEDTLEAWQRVALLNC